MIVRTIANTFIWETGLELSIITIVWMNRLNRSKGQQLYTINSHSIGNRCTGRKDNQMKTISLKNELQDFSSSPIFLGLSRCLIHCYLAFTNFPAPLVIA